LAATIAGAAIAMIGQQLAKRGETKIRVLELVLEQCAQLDALNADYWDRVWEERDLGLEGRVESWDVRGHRLATARIKVLCRDGRVLRALDEVNRTGNTLGSYWRSGQRDPIELEGRLAQFNTARAEFLAASAAMVESRSAIISLGS